MLRPFILPRRGKCVFLQPIMNIPKPIQKAMDIWYKEYAGHIVYLGEYQGKGAYCYHFDEPVDLGFPIVLLYGQVGKIEEIYGPKSFEIINSLVKDLDEVGVE